MADSLNFYELLQVDPRADREVIQAAYFRLAKKYHPDIDSSPEASEMMRRLNEAYSVLSDPQKRAKYDSQLKLNIHPYPKEWHFEKETTSNIEPVRCENCGRIDETIRATVFQYVISIVILSFKRAGGAGLLCSGCRRGRAIGYTLLSLLLGTWGFPWGILWTLEAVFVNLSGGRQPKEINGPLLRQQGEYFLSIGNVTWAITAFESSLKFEKNYQVEQVLQELKKKESFSPKRSNPDSNPTANAIGAVAFVLLLIAGIYLLFGSRTDNPQITTYSQPISIQPTTSYVQPIQNPVPTSAPTVRLPSVASPTSLPFSPTPAIERIFSTGPMEYGLRIGSLVEWNALGYKLVDYGRQAEVQMLFYSPNQDADLKLDFRFVADGQETYPNSVQVAQIDLARNTYFDEKAIVPGQWQSLKKNAYLFVIANFQIPASCANAGDQKDQCMRNKETRLKWVQYNISDRIWMFK